MNRRFVRLLFIALVLTASACSVFRPQARSANANAATAPDLDVVERDLSQPYERAQ